MTELSRLLGDLYGDDASLAGEEHVSYRPAAYPELDDEPLDGAVTDQPTAVGLLTAARPALHEVNDLRLGDEVGPVPARLGASERETSADEPTAEIAPVSDYSFAALYAPGASVTEAPATDASPAEASATEGSLADAAAEPAVEDASFAHPWAPSVSRSEVTAPDASITDSSITDSSITDACVTDASAADGAAADATATHPAGSIVSGAEVSAPAERWMPGDDDVLPTRSHRGRRRLLHRH
ncbi:MAG TPA: hypothetical protein VFP54_05015 [Acidimicrobiales bacterium]|nr:hypothetical protein [Acidimicrobiales bacterium]